MKSKNTSLKQSTKIYTWTYQKPFCGMATSNILLQRQTKHLAFYEDIW